jgi:hypothetical protein
MAAMKWLYGIKLWNSTMKETVQEKLEIIEKIWRRFICEYKFCKQRINATTTDYISDIIGYFHDTLDIVFLEKYPTSHEERFSYQISLLQAIYIHQDFIEEFLVIFRSGLQKGDLKSDPNYSINREIRNELVGHPIRKIEGQLISSTTFGYNQDNRSIVYLRYHKDNNFSFELKTFSIKDIQQRHQEFLCKYFDVILVKLKSILDEFTIQMVNLERVIDEQDFETVLKVSSLHFESILKYDYLYDKGSLINVYKRRGEHLRYKNIITLFYQDLRSSIKEKKSDVQKLFNKKTEVNNLQVNDVRIEIVLAKDSTSENKRDNEKDYHYELGKLATRNSTDFIIFGPMLKSIFSDNQLIITELNHMGANINDEIEYYSSYQLIWSQLGLNQEIIIKN